MTKRAGLWLIIAAAVAIAGATAFLLRPRRTREGEVLLLCGGSMRAAMEDVIRRYAQATGETVIASYGGSGELCAQIRQARKGDVFVCHDPFMPWADRQGLIDTWATIGYLDLVIVVAKGNPKGVKALADLAKSGLRLGIGDRTYSTSGQVVKHMLERLDYGEAILKNVRLETKGHQQRCTDVAMGALDAAIVWQAVAHLFRDRLEVIPIGREHTEHLDAVTSATYTQSDLRNVKVTIGVTRHAGDPRRARRFYEFVVAKCGDVFRRHGFRAAGE